MASAEAVVRRAEAAIQAGQKTNLRQAEGQLTLAAIAHAAHAGDPLSRQLFEEAGRHIGVALAGLINLLNPGLVIIGVGVDEARDLLLDPVQRAVETRTMNGAAADARILPGQLGRKAIAIGAVALVLQQSFQSPVAALGSI
jgi:predicted NBD/HSP70 family sugar kinase